MPPPSFSVSRGSGGRRGTDNADEHALEDDFRLVVGGGHKVDGYDDKGREEHTDALKGKVPLARTEVMHVDLAEGEV